ncbi:hypothetical protein ACNUIU_33530 [Pseudomonas aeruginosa]|uniref:hypothetical protein n=1 Tax=Pseudomonas aeruginosa TaxID=287 RepID=UPI003AAC43B7
MLWRTKTVRKRNAKAANDDYGDAAMNDFSEETRREVMKLAVQLVTTYVTSQNQILNSREQYWFGIEEKKSNTPPLPDLIEGVYRQLLGMLGK